MPLQADDTNMLSLDISSAIKLFCFGSFSGFFDRYKDQLPMAKSTFFRIMTGENVRLESIEAVEFLAKNLGLVEMGIAGSEFVSKNLCIKTLYQKLEAFFYDPCLTNHADLKRYAIKFKGVILK